MHSVNPVPSATLRPAVFLDRDGTLIEDRGHLRSGVEAVFFPDTAGALRRLQDRFLLFIVTNQPGIAEGILSHAHVEDVNGHIVERLAGEGVTIADVYYCPHKRTDRCDCIKPSPLFLHRAAARHGVDLGRSFVVGDHPHDVDMARRASAKGVYVLTGHGMKHLQELSGDATIIARDIGEAAELILQTTRAEAALPNLRPNPCGDLPEVAPSAYVDPSAQIVGKVSIGPGAFVGPGAVIRADETGPDGRVAPVVIGPESNVQDNVIIHALGGTSVTLGARASLSHGVIVHGPCAVGDGSFVGFRGVVFEARLGENVFVGHGALVVGADLPARACVPHGGRVTTEAEAKRMGAVEASHLAFMERVVRANLSLAAGYRARRDAAGG